VDEEAMRVGVHGIQSGLQVFPTRGSHARGGACGS
jgi:hypothetical protein